MGATPTFGVKVTVSALMAKLGITGRGAANDRLRDAEDRGFLRLVETPCGYGRTTPRIFEIAKTSEEIARDIAAGAAPGVFPSPDEVEKEASEAGSTPRYTGTDGTVSRAIPTVPLYQGLWCKRFEVEPSRRREVALDHAARTAFQILGAVLPLAPSLPSLN
jgi:hypothetical protein